MLKQLGRLERTRNIVILGFAILMAISLVFFYAPSRSATSIDPFKSTEVVATVGSNQITVAELARERERYGRNLGPFGGSRRVLDGLIGRQVILQEAERLGLGPSDAELAEAIRKQFSDASGNFIGFERYKERVTAGFGGIEAFENAKRFEIAYEKLKAFIDAGVNVSDEEVKEEYQRRYTSFDVNYIAVSADKLAAKIQPSEEELRSYFESHKDDYRYNEPQKKIRYLYIDTEKMGAKLPISEADLKAEYDQVKPEYKEAGVKVQQILLKVARKELDAQVEQKAKDLIAKLSGGTRQASEEAFAEAARGNSEDPATARNGGFLATPFKKNPNKAHGLYDRVADMQPGEISDIPIRYNDHWYILRRGESVPKTFEQAKPELLVSLRNSRGYSAAFQLAQKARTRLQETKDAQKVAQELAAEANMSPANMVRETPFVKPDDDVPNIGVNKQFEQALASLNNPNDVGEPTGVKGGFAIPLLVEKRDPRVPEFEEVKTKVSDALKQQKAKEQLEQKAKDLIAGLSGPQAIKAAGEREGFDSGYEEGFKLGSTLGKAGSGEAIDDLVFNLKEGEFTKTPIKVNDQWVIAGVVKRSEPDANNFAAERDRLKQSLLSSRQSQVFADYIASAQQRLKQDGKIKIYEEVLAAVPEPEAAAQPTLPGGFNFPVK